MLNIGVATFAIGLDGVRVGVFVVVLEDDGMSGFPGLLSLPPRPGTFHEERVEDPGGMFVVKLTMLGSGFDVRRGVRVVPILSDLLIPVDVGPDLGVELPLGNVDVRLGPRLDLVPPFQDSRVEVFVVVRVCVFDCGSHDRIRLLVIGSDFLVIGIEFLAGGVEMRPGVWFEGVTELVNSLLETIETSTERFASGSVGRADEEVGIERVEDEEADGNTEKGTPRTFPFLRFQPQSILLKSKRRAGGGVGSNLFHQGSPRPGRGGTPFKFLSLLRPLHLE